MRAEHGYEPPKFAGRLCSFLHFRRELPSMITQDQGPGGLLSYPRLLVSGYQEPCRIPSTVNRCLDFEGQNYGS